MKTNYFIYILILCAWCCGSRQLSAQIPRFKAGVIAGLTASQIDGDLSAGYNKLGLQAGLRGITRLQKRTEASIEFLYAQRGAQSDLVRSQYVIYFSSRLDYVEVPVQWHYKDWLIEGNEEKDDYYRVNFNIGLSYARLLGAHHKGDVGFVRVVAPDYLKKNDFSFLIGASFFASKHFGFTARYVRSLGYIYNPRDWNPAPYNLGWASHELYFQTFYLF